MKQILLMGVFVFFLGKTYGQEIGDIAFVGFNADGDDDFAIVVLSDLPASTTIYFTDNELDGSGALADVNEGTLQWVTPASVTSAGTIVTFTDTDAAGNASFGSSIGTLTMPDATINLSGSGDGIIAFLGTDEATPTSFLAAISNSTFAVLGDLTGSGLVEGVNVVVYSGGSGTPDGGEYNRSTTSGTKAELLIAINNSSNWTTETSNGENLLPFTTTSMTVSSNPSMVISGSEGWRILTTPTSNNSYDDMLGGLWTQGIATGADVTNGTANIQTYDGSSFSGISNMNSTMTAGQGFIFYAYSDDNFDATAEGFPKSISVSGTENSGDVSPTLNSGASDFTLVGNPYNSTIDWDLVSTTNVTSTAYVYDHSVPGYISWNGSTGSLTNGLIAPFQGFWVQNSALSPSLTIQEADQSSGGIFYKSVPVTTIGLKVNFNGLRNNTYFSFIEEASLGKDDFDAVKFPPLDVKPYASLATISEGNLFDINNLPKDFSNRLEIPLVFSAYDVLEGQFVNTSGTATLTWPEMKNIPDNWTISLLDREQDLVIDLQEVSEYVFEYSPAKSKRIPQASINPGSLKLKNATEERFAIIFENISSVNNELDETPLSFGLAQNYPNPFNPSTTINYNIEQAGAVNLSVYNLMGQRVATLVSEAKSAGTHSVRWNAAGAASGMYYYRLEANGQSITRKMTLIK